MRTETEIIEIYKKLDKLMWLGRSLALCNTYDDETKLKVEKEHQRIIEELGEDFIREFVHSDSDFDWGLLCGKVETLRWILGEDWGDLDS